MAESDFADVFRFRSPRGLCSRRQLCVLRYSNIVCTLAKYYAPNHYRRCGYKIHCLLTGSSNIQFFQKYQRDLKEKVSILMGILHFNILKPFSILVSDYSLFFFLSIFLYIPVFLSSKPQPHPQKIKDSGPMAHN